MTTNDEQEMIPKKMVINCFKKLSSHYVERFRTQNICDDRMTDGPQETFFIAIFINVYIVSTPLCV
jgi:hypothetical protein